MVKCCVLIRKKKKKEKKKREKKLNEKWRFAQNCGNTTKATILLQQFIKKNCGRQPEEVHAGVTRNEKKKQSVLHWSPPVESPIQEEGRGFALSHHTTRKYDSPFKEI